MKTRELRTSLSAGELDPRLHGRADLKDFQQGAKKLRNWGLMVGGGARRRWGFEYVADAANDGRLEEYIFSEGQEYVLFFKNAALAIYKSDGTECTITGSVAWSLAQVWEIDYAYFGDTIILTHKDVAIYKVLRTGSTAFTVSAFAFEVNSSSVVRQPYYKYAADSVTLTASATSGSGITFTASAAAFSASHVGTKIRYKKKQISVTGYTSPTVVTGTIDETLPATAADTDWDEQTYSAAHGYAIAVCFHENRLWFGGSRDAPTLLVASKLGAYFNYDVGTGLDTESIQTRVNFDRMGAIRYLTSGRHLLIHSDGQEVYAPNPTDKALTPGNISFRRQTPYGSAKVKVRLMEDSALFIQRTKTALRETLYDYLQSSYTGNALSLRSSHLLTGPRQMAVLHGSPAGPEQYCFVVQDSGSMAVLSSVRNEKLLGWTPWEMEGAQVLSACSTISTLFVLTKRTVSGVSRYYLEKANVDICLDGAKAITFSTTTQTLTGLSHLEGKVVDVVCGAQHYGTYTVAGGQIELRDAIVTSVSKTVYVGEAFESQIEPLPPVAQDQIGSLFTEMRRISQIRFLLRGMTTFKVENDRIYPYDTTSDLSLAPVPVTTSVEFPVLGYSRDPSLSASVGAPLPVEILAISMTVDS